MTGPFFPSVDSATLRLRDQHLPQRLQVADLNETIEDRVGSMFPGATYNDTLGTVTLPSSSAATGFADVRLGTGDGTTTAQTISAGSFTTVGLNTVITDSANRFSTSTGIYTCQAAGLYAVTARVRVVDGNADGRNVGVGVHTSNVDGAWFQWYRVATPSTGRWTAGYARTALFAAGDQLRLYCYSDGGSTLINTAGLTITYLGA